MPMSATIAASAGCLNTRVREYENSFGRFLVTSYSRVSYLSCGGPFDPQLHHLRLQRRPLHAEFRGGARRAADEPVGLLQRLTNMLALGVFQRRHMSCV